MRPGGYPVAIQNVIKDIKSLLLEDIVDASDYFVWVDSLILNLYHISLQ